MSNCQKFLFPIALTWEFPGGMLNMFLQGLINAVSSFYTAVVMALPLLILHCMLPNTNFLVQVNQVQVFVVRQLFITKHN